MTYKRKKIDRGLPDRVPYVEKSQCRTGKVGYWSRTDARKAKRQLPAHIDGRNLNPYECALCERWHLGHMPTTVANGTIQRSELVSKHDPSNPFRTGT